MLAWIGLNLASRGHSVEINPVIGLRNQRVERLVSELVGEAFDEVIPPTAAINIGYLSPEDRYEPFLFEKDRELDGTLVKRFHERVENYGLAFHSRKIRI